MAKREKLLPGTQPIRSRLSRIVGCSFERENCTNWSEFTQYQGILDVKTPCVNVDCSYRTVKRTWAILFANNNFKNLNINKNEVLSASVT
jgi:hypothetical protein